jgi:hypothetical protein
MGFAVGDGSSTADEYNIQLQYQKHLTAKQPDDMTVTAESSYANLHDASDHLIQDHLTESGDLAPYDYDRETSLDGVSPWVMKDILTIDKDGGQSNSLTRYFDAPLGFVLAVNMSSDGTEEDFNTSQPIMYMEAQRGTYKGVKASAIVNFNPRKIEKSLGK